MNIEAMIWFAVVLLTAGVVWVAEPYHTRLIKAAHEREEARDAVRKNG